MNHEKHLFEAMRAVEGAASDQATFANVSIAEAAAGLRRKLRQILDAVWRDAFDAGYAAALMDAAAGKSAAEQAARAAKDPHQTDASDPN